MDHSQVLLTLFRVSLKTINKRCIKALISAGAFDCFNNILRAQYFQSLITQIIMKKPLLNDL